MNVRSITAHQWRDLKSLSDSLSAVASDNFPWGGEVSASCGDLTLRLRLVEQIDEEGGSASAIDWDWFIQFPDSDSEHSVLMSEIDRRARRPLPVPPLADWEEDILRRGLGLH